MKKNRFVSLLAILGVFFAAACPLFAQVLDFTSVDVTTGDGPTQVIPVDVNGDGYMDAVCANFGFTLITYFGQGGGLGTTLSVFTNDGAGNLVLSATLTVGLEPVGIAAADVNGDGSPDLICANVGDDTLTVLTNDRKGNFTLSGTYNVGSAPVCVTTADVNGDGFVDLISADYGDATMFVLTNDGHGAFKLSSQITTGANPNCVAAADVNGDGKIDLVSANLGAQTVQTFTNNGRGDFTLGETVNISGGGPTWVAAADVDRDGTIDLITAGNTTTISVLTNNGLGKFSLKSTATPPAAALMVWAADMNGDGKIDFVCPDNTVPGSTTVFTNDGHGNFTINTTVPIGLSAANYPNYVAVADFTGDGNNDVVVSCFGTDILTELLRINATPLPTVAITSPANDAVFSPTESFEIDTSIQSPTQIKAVLFYLDNNVLGSSTSTPFSLTVLPGMVPAGSHALQAVVVQSSGPDGWSQVIQVNIKSSNHVVTPLAFAKTTLAVGSGPSFVLPVDLDGNGHVDLVTPDYGYAPNNGCIGSYNGADGSNMTLWINSGTGVFSSSHTIRLGDPKLEALLQPEPECVAAADLNGDGKLELIEVNFYYNTIGILTNNGSDVFSQGGGTTTSGRGPVFITTADVNGDGKPDIITANQYYEDRSVSVLTNAGNFKFAASDTLTNDFAPAWVAAADFNGDGNIDLVSANYGDCGAGNTLTVYFGDGKGGFTAVATNTVGMGPVCVVAADINGDGNIDLVSANQYGNSLTVLTNDGKGNFTLKATIPISAPSCLVATNITGTGAVDLACVYTSDSAFGNVAVLANDGQGNFTTAATVSVGAVKDTFYPVRLGAADFNGDGKMDLVVANYSDNSLTVLTQTTSQGPPPPPPPVVNITAPKNGASFSTSQSIVVTESASASVTQVGLYVDGQLLAQSTKAPYSFQIAAGTLAAGSHTLQTIAVNRDNVSGASAVIHITVTSPSMTLIDFDALNTSAGAVGGTLLADYLAGFGVAAENLTTGTSLEAVNTNSLTGGIQVEVPSAPNFFTQDDSDQPVSFALHFASPLQAFEFTRCGLSSPSGAVTHPQWTATIFDASGTELGSVSEPLIVSADSVPEKAFVLTGNGIASVRFDSDSQQIAAFSAVLLDNLDLIFTNVAPSLSVSLAVTSPPTNDIVAPATITLNAAVSNQVGTFNSISSVSFFAGPALLGTVTTSPYELTVAGLLPGNYDLQARVVNVSGLAAASQVVPITVQLQPNSTRVDFDALNASRGPVEGALLQKYLSSYGMTIADISQGTALAVESQQNIDRGTAVLASSPPNILTQTGSSGPVQFRLRFSPLLSQFGFTRPELLANPFVSHPAWQVTALDGAGNVLDQVAEGQIESVTNVASREFSLITPGGPGIAEVQFSSQGTGLTTFNAMLLDDFILTTNTSHFPPAVAIVQPADGEVLARPPAVTITAAAFDAAGITGVTFYTNGSPLGFVTTSPYTIVWTNPQLGNHTLRAEATNAFGLTHSSALVHIVIEPLASLFRIASQPLSQTAAVGSSATFTVVVTGTNGVAYQWSHNNVPISGATSSTLVLPPPITANDAGSYTVVATETGGTALTSIPAILTVLTAPIFTAQPQGQTVAPGTSVTLTAAASGTGPFSWQWLLNGETIPGATDNTFSIPVAQPLDSGNYQVAVANGIASRRSVVASVIVETPVTIPEANDSFATAARINPLTGPVSDSNVLATVQPGAPLPDGLPGGNSIWFSWQATFTGTITLTTEGSDFDTVMAVYTGTQLKSLKPVAADDDSGGYLTSLVTFNVTAGTDYQIAVDGFEGVNGRVVLGMPAGTGYRVLNPSSGDAVPVIVRQPASKVVAPNASATLAVQAGSSSKLDYQWYFQGAPIPGAIGSALTLTHVGPGSVGFYYVVVANSAGSAQSEPASVQIGLTQDEPQTSTENKFFNGNPVSPKLLAIRLEPLVLGGDTRGFSVAQTFSTVGAATEAGQPDPCGQAGGAAQWFVYMAPAFGSMHISLAGSAFNTLLGVYTGSGASFSDLAEAGCGYATNYLTEGQPSVVLENVAEGTTFYILIEGYLGASGVAQLQVGLGQPLLFRSLPPGQTVTAGTTATFNVTAAGSTPIFYQWQLNGVNVPGATADTLKLANAQEEAVGNYTVIVSNMLGPVTSSPPAALNVQYAPAIVSEPTNETVKVGAPAKFSVTALGVNVRTNPLVFQWYFDGAPLKHATTLTLSIPVARSTNAGTYFLVITNRYGSVTSDTATLTVIDNAAVDSAAALPPQTAGTYSGLFYSSDGAVEESAGYFTATIISLSSGAFSGSLLLEGDKYPFTGKFDSAGTVEALVPREGKSSVTASLRLHVDPPDGQMSGVISAPEWRSVLQAGRAEFNTANNPAPVGAAEFALVVPSGTGAPVGYLNLTNTAAGAALVTGTLADGAAIVRAAPMVRGDKIPLYAPLYSGKGAFLGWISFTNPPGRANFPDAFWIKPGLTNATRVLIVK